MMPITRPMHAIKRCMLIIFTLCLNMSFTQDKLKKMPGYERYSKVAPKIRNSVKLVSRVTIGMPTVLHLNIILMEYV